MGYRQQWDSSTLPCRALAACRSHAATLQPPPQPRGTAWGAPCPACACPAPRPEEQGIGVLYSTTHRLCPGRHCWPPIPAGIHIPASSIPLLALAPSGTYFPSAQQQGMHPRAKKGPRDAKRSGESLSSFVLGYRLLPTTAPGQGGCCRQHQERPLSGCTPAVPSPMWLHLSGAGPSSLLSSCAFLPPGPSHLTTPFLH